MQAEASMIYDETVDPGVMQPMIEIDIPSPEDSHRDMIDDAIASCAKFVRYYFDMGLRRVCRVILYCHRWREGCERCLHMRANELRQNVHRALEISELRVVTLECSKAEVDEFVRKNGLKKDDYKRLPHGVYETIVMREDTAKARNIETGWTVTQDDAGQVTLAEIDWLDIAMTTEGRKLSGSLGKAKDDPTSEKRFLSVQSIEAGLDVPQDVIEKIMQDAMNLYAPKIPQTMTLDELQAASDAAMQHVFQVLSARGLPYELGPVMRVAVETSALRGDNQQENSGESTLELPNFIDF